MSYRSLIWAVAILAAISLAGVSEACPTCKDGITEDGGHLVRGYFWSIMFMMSMPFVILTGLSGMFYLDVRRARRAKAAEATTDVA